MTRAIGIFFLVIGFLVAGIGVLGIVVNIFFQGAGNFLVFAIFGFVGVVFVVVGLLVQRMAKVKVAQKEGTDGRVGNYLADVTETRISEDGEFEVLYQKPVEGKNGRPSSLLVRAATAAPTTLRFNRETWLDRLCKRVGVAHEHQTGDMAFDEAIYIRGPSFGFAELYLEDGTKREAILRLMDLGFQEIRLTETATEASWPSFNPLTDDYPELMDDTSQELFTLADEVPEEDPDLAAGRSDWRKGLTIFLWVLALGIAATLTFAFVYPPIRTWDLAQPALNLFVVAYPFFVVSTGILLHGTSTSHDRWKPLVFVGFFLFGLGSVGTVAGVNGIGDDSPGVDRKLIIHNKWTQSGRRGSTSYHVHVSDWNRPGENIDFSVSFNEYLQIVVNRTHLNVTTAAGRLGIEWLKSQRVQ